MSTLKTYAITIFGQSFNLVSDESSQDVEAIASRVDALMNQISDESGVSDCKKVAILAAVKLLCQVRELEKSNNIIHDECHTLTKLIDGAL